ncbi:MAG: hypothetical protein WDA75_05320 [Candidatus Latescibacterota bacterium]|jgi:hypothetical protein
MDKIVSARIDEGVAQQIDWLARQLKTSKKDVLESAIRQYAQAVSAGAQMDVFAQTQGAWKREESPDVTVGQARQAFRASLERGHG